MIKLNTNENPYQPAPGVKRAMEEMDYSLFRKYPDPGASVLVDALAEYYKIESNRILVGVGSDDVIAMAFLTFFNSEKPVAIPHSGHTPLPHDKSNQNPHPNHRRHQFEIMLLQYPI